MKTLTTVLLLFLALISREVMSEEPEPYMVVHEFKEDYFSIFNPTSKQVYCTIDSSYGFFSFKIAAGENSRYYHVNVSDVEWVCY